MARRVRAMAMTIKAQPFVPDIDTIMAVDIAFGHCTKCGDKVAGHAVYVFTDYEHPPKLVCSYCELDTYFKKLEDIMKGVR
jgi:hypothetical protein